MTWGDIFSILKEEIRGPKGRPHSEDQCRRAADRIHEYHGQHEHLRHHHHHRRVLLFVEGVGIQLHPDQENRIMLNVSIGHTVGLALLVRDQNGNPMVTQPAPDGTPTWNQSTPATETLTAAPDGATAQLVPLAVGTDAVSVSLQIGGASFSASLSVNVQAAAQVPTSVEIVPTVS